jgi:hypothetical protein
MKIVTINAVDRSHIVTHQIVIDIGNLWLQPKIINYKNCLELCRKHVLNVVGILNVLNQWIVGAFIWEDIAS